MRALSPDMLSALILASSAVVTLIAVCALCAYDFTAEMMEAIGLALLSDEARSLLDEDCHAMVQAWSPAVRTAVALQPFLFTRLSGDPSPALVAHLAKFTGATRASNSNSKEEFQTVQVNRKPIDRHELAIVEECKRCWVPPNLELADTIRTSAIC